MTASILRSEAFDRTRRTLIDRLLGMRNDAGHWTGTLSSSALSTATAITALGLVEASRHAIRIASGARWLVETQCLDGSWGDTPVCRGNLSTTLLAWGALSMVRRRRGEERDAAIESAIARAESWIQLRAGGLEDRHVADALERVYGRDRTFAVPILTMLVLCGCFGDPRDGSAWTRVHRLPYELAALPQSWFRMVDMQVVSYALPALSAIGQVRESAGTVGGLRGLLRRLSRERTLRTLAAIQPAGGGYLEATPLTSFVTMSLAGMGLVDHEVVREAVSFLAGSMQTDGSWPIDTNLATWVTTRSIAALAAGGRLGERLSPLERQRLRHWLLAQQWQAVHPYTGAAPGGWAWTDLPGGVPDADDTSGAIVALANLEAPERRELPDEVRLAGSAGLSWLAGLANRDGGLPTFCRGWGRLPFDTSCADITAHAILAAGMWQDLTSVETPATKRLLAAARRFLATAQRSDGSWVPLWFGNERQEPAQENPVYGTSRVLVAIDEQRAIDWLTGAIGADGGFGGDRGLEPSIEETSLAVEALARVAEHSPDVTRLSPSRAARMEKARAAVEAGVRWLVERTDEGSRLESAPIGLYFAKLWYSEETYPPAFMLAALERASRLVPAR
ncbi:MAG: prenyltransferase/squalene oxidase repeat-containing protein [Planctomycetaceae bacterium]